MPSNGFFPCTAMEIVGLRNPKLHVNISSEIKEDFLVWKEFMDLYNDRSFWQEDFVAEDEIQLFTDAADSDDFGAFFEGRWCAEQWHQS